MCNMDAITLLGVGLYVSVSFCYVYLAAFCINKSPNIRLEFKRRNQYLSVACKCSSASRDLNTDLLTFIYEKNRSHTYVLSNIAIILAAAASNLGNVSREMVVMTLLSCQLLRNLLLLNFRWTD